MENQKIKNNLNFYSILFFLIFALSFITRVKPSPTDVVWLITFIIGLISGFFHINFKYPRNLFYLLGLYWLITFFSVFYAPDKIFAFQYFIITSYLMIFSLSLVWNLSSKIVESRAILYGIYLACFLSVISCLLGLFGVSFFLKNFFWHSHRALSLFHDPNVFASWLIIAIFFIFDGAQNVFKFCSKLWHYFFVLLACIVLLLTLSRGALTNYFFVYLTYTLIHLFVLPQKSFKKPLTILIITLISIPIFLLLVRINPIIYQKILDRFQIQYYDLYERVDISSEALSRLFTNLKNFSIGHGLRGSRAIPTPARPWEIAREPHNTYIEILYEQGLIGFLLFILILGYLIIRLWLLLKNGVSYLQDLSLPVIFSCLVGLLIEGFVFNILHWRHFWLLFGLGIFFISYKNQGLLLIQSQK